MKLKIFNLFKNISNKIRTKFYKSIFSSFGSRSRVLGRIKVYSPQNIFFGKHSTLNEGVLLNARTKLIIGDHVHISPYTIINTGGLDYTKKMEKRIHLAKEVKIEDGVWIGSGVIINPGVIIGKNSVIAAGSVVSKDIPKNVIVAGVPTKVIKNI